MRCPFCDHGESKVVDSRDSGDEIRRRRECLQCSRRFTTYERAQTRIMQVVKRDERREEFNREKLWNSLTKACAKRPLAIDTIQKIADEIHVLMMDSGRAEIPSKAIGAMVMDRLKAIDRVAYIRYASVYRDFSDIETFKEEIDALLEPQSEPEVPVNQLTFLEDEPLLPQPRRRGRRPRRSPTNTPE